MFHKFLLTDTSGKKSSTLTAFVLGFIVVNLKLILSGITLGDYSMSEFDGGDYSMALGALGAIYVLRRSTDKKDKEDKGEKND